MSARDSSAGTPQRARLFTTESGELFDSRRLRLISYNIQVGISATRFRHYVTHSWKHFLPHAASFDNLDRIGELINQFDIVALQEADAGSFRSFFINQVEYLARRGHFPHWYYQTNRNLGRFAQHSMGLLTRILPFKITEHRLPGLIPGRGVMEVHFGQLEEPLVLLLLHLGLAKRARLRQIDYISRIVNDYRHVVVMGDFNCRAHSEEMDTLVAKTDLGRPVDELPTFPSWRPMHNIDHILVTPSLKIREALVIQDAVSDHLPIAVDVLLPESIHT
jgi:endonuclease/exonuclease/phosphatase family metal-dependent hydrolase